ncbi:hypothetical protein RQP46_003599 [Phenoliferia psychrophenolica]
MLLITLLFHAVAVSVAVSGVAANQVGNVKMDCGTADRIFFKTGVKMDCVRGDPDPTTITSGLPICTAPPSTPVVLITSVLTTKSTQLAQFCATADLLNVATVATQIAPRLLAIAAEVGKSIATITAGRFGPCSCQDSDDIVAAITRFVAAEQNLLSVVIVKHKLSFISPFFLPINAALKAVQLVLDQLLSLVIGIIPTRACQCQIEINFLKAAIDAALASCTNSLITSRLVITDTI